MFVRSGRILNNFVHKIEGIAKLIRMDSNTHFGKGECDENIIYLSNIVAVIPTTK